MEPRKLVKAGASSLVVSLPKKWVSKKGLSTGDVVYISELNDGSIRLSAARTSQPEERKATITTDGKSLQTLKREITSAYLNNFDTIDIIGEAIKAYHLELRKLVHDFVAFEITEQTATRITAKDLLNREEVSVDKTLRRMDMTVRSMLSDVFSEPISIRDHDVNRMYFLINKLLKHSVQDHAVAEQINVQPAEILATWDLCSALESIADDAVELAKVKKTRQLEEAMKLLKEKHEMAIGAFFSRKLKDAEQVSLSREEVQDGLKKLPAGAKEMLSSIHNNIQKIARIAIDR